MRKRLNSGEHFRRKVARRKRKLYRKTERKDFRGKRGKKLRNKKRSRNKKNKIKNKHERSKVKRRKNRKVKDRRRKQKAKMLHETRTAFNTFNDLDR